MASIIVDQIHKSFGALKAVNGVSFEVQPGEIFGLLGPNGAGKTTAIRIILDIFKPDSGSVEILGGKMDEQKKEPHWLSARGTWLVPGHSIGALPHLPGDSERT